MVLFAKNPHPAIPMQMPANMARRAIDRYCLLFPNRMLISIQGAKVLLFCDICK